MKPTRIEYAVGRTIYGQELKLVKESDSSNRTSWSLYQAAANQRDDSAVIRGIADEVITKMADAIKHAGQL